MNDEKREQFNWDAFNDAINSPDVDLAIAELEDKQGKTDKR